MQCGRLHNFKLMKIHINATQSDVSASFISLQGENMRPSFRNTWMDPFGVRSDDLRNAQNLYQRRGQRL